MGNCMFLAVLALAIVYTAGCTGISGAPLLHSETPQGTTDTLAPDTRPEPPGNNNGTAAMECIERTGNSRSYPLNITDANEHSLTRKEFLEVNREYMAFLARELGQEKAEQMIHDEYSRAMGPSLLDPSSGNDTLIFIIIDPVGDHVAGETFNISGSTNLPPGRELTLAIFRGNYDRPIPPGEDSWHDPVLRTAGVQKDTSSRNVWSYRMDTQGMAGDDYLIYVRESQKDAFYANTLFHLFSREVT